MKISFFDITKDKTQVIKAFAIIAITFHNILTWGTPIGENEMQLNPQRIFNLFHFMKAEPARILDALFSYFGHYGVQLFIFASGYGLIKMFKNNPPATYKEFFGGRVKKLYSLVLVGILFSVPFFLNHMEHYFKDVVFLTLTMLKNLSYNTLFAGIGTWWYFSLALQLYFVFPFLYEIILKYGKKGFYVLLLISYVVIYLIFPITEKLHVPLYGNFIGHLPEFLLGMSLAYFKDMKLSLVTIILSLVLFIVSNFSEYFFPFSFLSVTVLMLVSIYFIMKILPAVILRGLVFIGKISMFIFVINGPVRYFSLRLFVERLSFSQITTSFFHFFIVLLLSWLLYIVCQKTVSLFNKPLESIEN